MFRFLSAEGKRQQMISEATMRLYKGDSYWFDLIKRQIDKSSPGKRIEVILRWVKSCEKIGSEVVKIKILDQYEGR